MANEGLLFKGSFGGNPAHTEDHPPVILSGKMKAGHGGVDTGTVLSINAGVLEKYNGTGKIAGVCEIPVNDAENTVSYLAHGTVKATILKKADGTPFDDYLALSAIGIYSV